MIKQYFISGIGTDIGKTIISSICVEALQADYWKPVQCGELENTDASKIKDLISNPITKFHPESYLLKHAMSPHAAAKLEHTEIHLSAITIPYTTNHLVVEGAGGLLVPLNTKALVIDLIQQLHIPVILVSRNYLGSINHTLLSIEALQKRNIPIAGIIFNDTPTPETENYILEYTGIKLLGNVPHENVWNKDKVKHYAENFKLTI